MTKVELQQMNIQYSMLTNTEATSFKKTYVYVVIGRVYRNRYHTLVSGCFVTGTNYCFVMNVLKQIKLLTCTC